MFSNKIATVCYVDEPSLLLLFLSQYSFLTCPFSKELENGWLGIFPLTSALYRPAWAGRPVWAEAVSILMLLASLLIRLFFKRTKQIIQSKSKSIIHFLSKELENGWLGIFPLTSALYRPAWAGRPVWAEAVSILMLLASLLIRLFFKRTKQIIQSESKSIKQWLWFSLFLFRDDKEENHKVVSTCYWYFWF